MAAAPELSTDKGAGGAQTIPQRTEEPDRKLGRLPRKGDARDILDDRVFRLLGAKEIPDVYRPYRPKRPYPREAYGNDDYGDCTKASQAIAVVRLELLEQRRRIAIDTQSVIDSYLAMTTRLYGGGDTGAYETDALSDWRRAENTFKDTKGRPYTIDAYTRVNVSDKDAIRGAIVQSAGRILKVCANMPLAWRGKEVWDAPLARSDYVGEWLPGSWGGHSMTISANDRGTVYDGEGVYIQTWDDAPRLVTWAAFFAYFDEAHRVVDSVNAWRKRLGREMNAKALVAAVNDVSSYKLKAA